jgi:hypothetical protein
MPRRSGELTRGEARLARRLGWIAARNAVARARSAALLGVSLDEVDELAAAADAEHERLARWFEEGGLDD